MAAFHSAKVIKILLAACSRSVMSVTEQLIESFKLKLRLRDAVEDDGGATTEGRMRKSRLLRRGDRDKRLLGYMAISVARTDGLEDALWVDDLAVVPDAYGKGIGASFFKRIAGDWHSERYNEIHLLVRHEAPQQEHALKLYEDLGFKYQPDPTKRHYEERDGQQYMTAPRTEVLQKARVLLNKRPIGEGIKLRFAFEERWMQRNAPEIWEDIKILYGSVHITANGDGEPIENVLQDGRDGEPASMFLVAMGEM
jgi:GNAT superfamily N-acetyltransferase